MDKTNGKHTDHPCFSYFYLMDPEIKLIDEIIASMDIPQMVGQLFTVFMFPESCTAEQQIQVYTDRLRKEVETYHPGGYYLDRFYEQSTVNLVRLLQKQSKIPMFIAADMENGAGGGFGGVIAESLTHFPSLMAIGASSSPHYAYSMGYWTAFQAQSIDTNLIFSPSLDINSNPRNPIINVRSFGEDPYQVSLLGEAYIDGIQDGGAIPCAKHFPGHGNTTVDSHLQLSRVDVDIETLIERELLPFRRAIENVSVEMIMTGHICVPALDGDQAIPATFSSVILTNLLRQDMKFEGVIITDALLMGGITQLCDPGEAAVRAILAGVDILLMPPDLDAAYQGVLRAVQQKRISEERLIDSVTRILALKATSFILDSLDFPSFDLSITQLKRANRMSLEISSDAVTMVKNKESCIPLSMFDRFCIFFLQDQRVEQHHQDFFEPKEAILIETHPDEEVLNVVEQEMKKAEAIVIMADIQVLPEKDNLAVPAAHDALIQQALQTEKDVILVSFGNPYLINQYPDVSTYLCAYRFSEQMYIAVMDILHGYRVPHGRLPITLSEKYPQGHGMLF